MEQIFYREAMLSRDDRLQMARRCAEGAYLLLNLCLAAYFIAQGQPYYYIQCFGTLLLLPALAGAYRILRMPRANALDLVILTFTFFAHTVGVILQVYHKFALYDKIMHMLSGTLTAIIAYPVFYLLKPGHKIDRQDFPLAAFFTISVALAVGGVWEIGEYVISLLTGIDTQMVLTRGIHDTMQDMIVCTVGAVLLLPAIRSVYHKPRPSVWMLPSLALLLRADREDAPTVPPDAQGT